MERKIHFGATSVKTHVFVPASNSTTGGGLTGLTSSTSGLTAYYIADGQSSTTAISLSAGTLGTWSSGGFVAVDGTNMPGVYELGIPNAALSVSNATFVTIYLQGAANMAPVPIIIELDAINYQDGVHAGLTALPNAAAAASGGLPTVGTGSGQIEPDGSGNVYVSPGTGTGQISLSSGKVLLQATQTGVTIPTVTAVTNAVSLGAGEDAAIGKLTFDGSNNIKSAPQTLSAVNGTGSNQISLSSGAVLLQPTQTGVTIPTVTTVTNQLTAAAIATATAADVLSNPSNLLKTDSSGDVTFNNTSLSGSVGSVTGAVGSVTGNVGGNVVGSVASVTAQVTANVTDILGVAPTLDGNNNLNTNVKDWDGTAVGALVTPPSAASIVAALFGATLEGSLTYEQVLHAIQACLLGDAAVTGSAVVFKRGDNSTTAWTIDFDSSGNRTSSTPGTL